MVEWRRRVNIEVVVSLLLLIATSMDALCRRESCLVSAQRFDLICEEKEKELRKNVVVKKEEHVCMSSWLGCALALGMVLLQKNKGRGEEERKGLAKP